MKLKELNWGLIILLLTFLGICIYTFDSEQWAAVTIVVVVIFVILPIISRIRY